MEEGLKMLLRPHNHAFVWKPVPPFPEKTNAPYQLEEIHVFRPGEKDLMVSIDASDLDRPRIDEMVTQVIILDNKIYVPVTLGYQINCLGYTTCYISYSLRYKSYVRRILRCGIYSREIGGTPWCKFHNCIERVC